MTKKIQRKKRINLILTYIILFLAAFFIVSLNYKNKNFKNSKIDEILFYFSNGLFDGNSSTMSAAFKENIALLFITFVVISLPIINSFKQKISFDIEFSIFNRKKKRKTIVFSEHTYKRKLYYASVLFLVSAWHLMSAFGVQSYIYALTETSTIYEDNYVRPENVKLEFPEKKRNLIYITMESMENTMLSIDNGGQSQSSIIPELENIALNNTSFSNTKKLGGALPAKGTTWTVAGMTAHSSGVPLMDSIRNNMGYFKEFLPGAYSLGQILEKQGYNQTFVLGSKASFGGRDKLFTQHGNFNIYDYEYAKKIGKFDPDYKVWWGYEDKKLFQYAKEEAIKLSKSDKPFNLQILTVDTHFTDGWMDETCQQPYDNQYSNVYACSSKQIFNFIEWVKKQPFAKNTTIVLSGDHLGMQTSYYIDLMKEPKYQRTIYNAFINPAVTPIKSKDRLFTSFDMYPTTLAALGVRIPGDKLGLGVNLFSKQQTLLEKYGNLEDLNLELSKYSEFYSKKIFTIQKETQKNKK